MYDNILTFGITELEKYPFCKYKIYCKQFIERCNLSIPCEKPNIESIDNICVTACVKSFKLIKTILGYKLIVEGIIKYKVMYTADTIGQSVHSAHFEHSFCNFILLDKICSTSATMPCISDVFIGIEDIVINSYDCNNIDICVFLIMYPLVNDTPRYSCKNSDDYDFYC